MVGGQAVGLVDDEGEAGREAGGEFIEVGAEGGGDEVVVDGAEEDGSGSDGGCDGEDCGGGGEGVA